jgi:hypothetical protein
MAILLVGKTTCSICGNVIIAGEPTVGFPHFILNERDPLFALSDSSCHSACVNASPLGSAMLAATDELYKSTGPGKRACAVCSDQVLDPDDYMLIGYLGAPSAGPLAKFSYTHLHKSHIAGWKRASEFLALARAAVSSDEWQGDALSKVIQEIEASLLPL